MAPRRATTLGFAIAICIAATTVVVTEVVGEGWSLLREERPAFAVLGAALLASELRPASWLRHNGRSATLSWVFAFALLLLGGHLETLLLMAGVSVLSELSSDNRKPLLILTNSAQLVLALAAALCVLRVTGTERSVVDGETLDVRWAASVAAAGAVLYLTNVVIVAAYAAILGRGRIGELVPRFARLNLTGDGMLIALAPVLVIVSERSLLVLPFVGVTMAALNWTSRTSASHQREAEHDALTGLPNRRRFLHELEAFVSSTSGGTHRGAVVMLDLDGFKPINDRFGHAAGDEVLCEVARRLTGTLPGDAVAARLGGDEFAVLLPDVADGDQADDIVAVLRQAIRAPMTVTDTTASVDGSFGIALVSDHGADLPSILAAADRAMYRVKYGRRDRDLSGSARPEHRTDRRRTNCGSR